MSIPSALWDWVAVLSGLSENSGFFMPLYWSVPAWLCAPFGWVPTPAMVLALLVVISLSLSALFYCKRNPFYMVGAAAIWGALVADTPYVVILPLLVSFVWSQVVRFAYWRSRGDVSLKFRAPTPLFLAIFAIFAFMVVIINFIRFQSDYIIGYARNAVAAVHLDGRLHPRTNAAMDELLNEYVTELAQASRESEWIFTDGLCDAGILLAAKGEVKPISLAGDVADSLTWRRRGFSSFEDISALESGAIGLLRTWAVDRPENLKRATFQCGFTFLENSAPGKLNYDGLVMKGSAPTGGSERVRKLGERIVAFYEAGYNPLQGGRMRSVRFCSMQWRVARAIRRNALKFDKARELEAAMAETELSEKLDQLNPFAKRANMVASTTDLQAFGTFTPRECLHFALSRANFTLARAYAKPILKDDPENVEANFAMAMSHLQSKEYELARHYLRKALKVRPDDPALLNNLAVAEMELGEFAAAKAHAEKALRAKPDEPSIKNTLRQIELKQHK